MGKYSEVFVAFDVAKKKHAVAIAEGGRTGEVRFLGDVETQHGGADIRRRKWSFPVAWAMDGPQSRDRDTVERAYATIGELDLADVPPTSHVVEVTGRLRPDEPRPSWPRAQVLAAAPEADEDGFLVPSPQA